MKIRTVLEIFVEECSPREGVDLLEELLELPYLDTTVLPMLGKLAEKQLEAEHRVGREILAFYARICRMKRPLQRTAGKC